MKMIKFSRTRRYRFFSWTVTNFRITLRSSFTALWFTSEDGSKCVMFVVRFRFFFTRKALISFWDKPLPSSVLKEAHLTLEMKPVTLIFISAWIFPSALLWSFSGNRLKVLPYLEISFVLWLFWIKLLTVPTLIEQQPCFAYYDGLLYSFEGSNLLTLFIPKKISRLKLKNAKVNR